ncbi:MAG: 30S ribosomal protein S20 [Candidatus Babeliales bacterium]|jgi:small subunit ribosomal protein S20
MANLKSAKKRARQCIIRKQRNQTRRSEIKTLTKKFLDAVASKDVAQAKEILKLTESKIARAKSKRVIQSNAASRNVSAMAKKLSALEKKIV